MGRADETNMAVKYRLEDFTTQLNLRVTKDYVEILGKQIKSGIIDSFDRKNEDTLEKMQHIVNANSVKQDQLTIDTNSKLKDYRVEITNFKKEFYEKATKADFLKSKENMEQIRAQFDM